MPGRRSSRGRSRDARRLLHGAPAAPMRSGGTTRWHAGRRTTSSSRAHTPSSWTESRSGSGRWARSAPGAAAADERTSLEGEPEPGDRRAPEGHGRVRRGRLRRRSTSAAERGPSSSCSTPTSPPTAARGASRTRTRSLPRERDRGAGHGLSRRRPRAARPPPRGQLLRELPSPRGRTSRSTTRRASGRRSSTRSTTRADPGRPRQVAPERPRRVAARGAPGLDDRPAGERGGDAGAHGMGGRGGAGQRRDPARDRPVAATARARRRSPPSAAARSCARARRAALRVRAGDAPRGAHGSRGVVRRPSRSWRCRG